MTNASEARHETAVIDRIANHRAVLLVGNNETEWVLPVENLPINTEAGDWLNVVVTGCASTGQTLTIAGTESTKTAEMKAAAKKLRSGLLRRGRHQAPSDDSNH